jgi:hypothetical protein
MIPLPVHEVPIADWLVDGPKESNNRARSNDDGRAPADDWGRAERPVECLRSLTRAEVLRVLERLNPAASSHQATAGQPPASEVRRISWRSTWTRGPLTPV